MNYYIVTEGKCEKKVYKKWIRYVNPELTPIEDIRDVGENNFFILHANGQPDFFDVCAKAILDVNQYNVFDKLVLVVDCEDDSHDDKEEEIIRSISSSGPCKAEIHFIIQNFCLETWALGNTKIHRTSPNDATLREYRKFFDLRSLDPEDLRPISEEYNRAQFAYKYLKAAIRDTYVSRSYNKNKPDVLCSEDYFSYIRKRFEKAGHIQSFKTFLDAFA